METFEQGFNTFSQSQVLRKEVCGVDLTPHLTQLQGLQLNLVLNPQRLRLDVPQLTKTSALANAERSRGVCPDSQGHLPTKVRKQTLLP